MLNEDFLVEYYGVTPSKYPFPTVIEKIIYLPDNIKIKSLIRIHTSLEVIFSNKNNSFNGIDCNGCNYPNGIFFCVCTIPFNIEYIADTNTDTINIFSDYIYSSLHLPIDNTSSQNSLSPKISHIHLKLLDSSSIYLYLSICPY